MSVSSTVLTVYTEMAPWAQATAGLMALAIIAIISRFVAQGVLLHFVRIWRNSMPQGWAQILLHDHVLIRIAKITPSVVVQLGVHWVQNLPETPHIAIRNAAAAFTIYHVMRALTALLSEINEAHDRHDGPKATQTRSIKSYVQLGKLLVYAIGTLLIVACIMDRSPLLLLSGLGAMSAVLMLVFKDTILSFVAGVQIASNDMMRVGDWIEMPQVGADGFVVDIALNTVKVQNWDKTITTIPTWKLMSESFKNWRGMTNSGGRRILRALHIDAATVHLLTAQEREALSKIALLKDYWNERDGLLAQPESAANAMPTQAIAPELVTNLAAFKAYAYGYLMAHPRISKAPGMFLLVRTLEPSPTGIPLQLYCYTATTVWMEYEGIQGEVFDHLIGVMPLFGLSLYQRSSDYSNRQIVQALNHDEPSQA